MDVTSYLLGKQAGGGSTPTLQNKSVTITENGTTNVTADTGYDGLSKVEVTTNVSGGSTDDKYFNKIVTNYYSNNKETLVGQQVIKELPAIDLSTTITGLDYAFQYFRVMVKAPNMDTKNVIYMRYMFDYCNQLREMPIYDTSSLQEMDYAFRYCNNLTDNSLDNILQMCINAKSYKTESRTLSSLGLTSTKYPVSRIEALPHYQDFVNAGWIIGY